MNSVHDPERHHRLRFPRLRLGMPTVWLVVATVAVCGTFSGVYITTGDIWTATFAGGLPALLYGVGLTVHALCAPASRVCRIAVITVAVTLLTGISAQFMILSSNSRWRSDQMVGMGESYDRGAMMCALFSTASPVFASYQERSPRKRIPVADVFKASRKTLEWTEGVARLESPSERVNVYASSTSPGAIIFTAVATITKGKDPGFVNLNGTVGYLQSRVCVTPMGMAYEIDN